MNEPNDQELIFMETLVDLLKQFAECNEEDALEFTLRFMDKLDKKQAKL
jgi:hypothetical protein